MKEKFPIFYPDFEKLWKEAVFVFDTNVILDILRLPADESASLLSILQELKKTNLIWIPYQVAYEYHKNFREVIVSNRINSTSAFNTIKDSIDKLITNINQNYKRGLPDVNIDSLIQELTKTQKSINKIFINAQTKESDFEKITKEIDKIFSVIGDDFSDSIKETKLKEAEERFKRLIPPGYADKDKETNKYGDVFIWFQMMDFSKQEKKDIIFVTGDAKKDWFSRTKDGNQIISPRPELLLEFYKETNQIIYIYQLKNFIKTFNSNETLPKESKLTKEKETSLLNLITTNTKQNYSRDKHGIQLGGSISYNSAICSRNGRTNNLSMHQVLNPKSDIIVNEIDGKTQLVIVTPENKKQSLDLTSKPKRIVPALEQDQHISEMKKWFLAHYEDPVEHCPYESREGGYIYIYGGPYDPYEELDNEFGSIYSSEEIKLAAEEIVNETSVYEWSGKATDDFIK